MNPLYNVGIGTNSANTPLLNTPYNTTSFSQPAAAVQTAQPVGSGGAIPVQQTPGQAVPPYSAPPVAQPAAAPATAIPVSTAIPVAPAAVPMAQPAPAHLDALMQFPAVRVVENINLWEVMTNYEAEKKFAVFLTNEDGEITPNQIPFFNAYEESECCSRQMCGNNREFIMHLCGPDGSPLVHMHRPFTFFCLNTPEMRLFDANDEVCGVVKSVFNCCDRVFYITDEKNEECMTINGSCCQAGNFCFCPCSPCDEIVFDVVNNRTGTNGIIKKKWDTWARDLFTNADTFTINFPPESTLHERILLLAATFLINIMYFNQENNNQSHNRDYGGGNYHSGYAGGFMGGLIGGGIGGFGSGSSGSSRSSSVDYGGFDGGGGGGDVDYGGFDGGGGGGDVDFGGFDDCLV